MLGRSDMHSLNVMVLLAKGYIVIYIVRLNDYVITLAKHHSVLCMVHNFIFAKNTILYTMKIDYHYIHMYIMFFWWTLEGTIL